MKHLTWLFGSFLAALALCGCEISDPISNGDLDEWCGDTPCGWEVEGEIKRVSTWHANDYAVSFEGEDAQLWQVNRDLSYPECLAFTMVARVSPGTRAFVELDFFNDGSVDWDAEIPAGDFRELSFSVRTPDRYEGVRFIVRKEGKGELVLARLHADVYGGSCSGDQVVLKDLPGGMLCEVHENCLSGTCLGGYCVGCESDDDCEGDDVCGYDSAASGAYSINVLPLCVPAGYTALGELCIGDAECESGVCCEGACSECCGETGCDGEETCTRALAGDGAGNDVREPFLCSAGEQTGQEGDACTSDRECEGSCIERQCTGLCLPFSGDDINSRCAMLECEEASCDLKCQLETVEVGTCD